jgi:hypothetical protein
VAGDFSGLPEVIDSLPKPVGLFLTLEIGTPDLYAALAAKGGAEQIGARVIVAGTTPFYLRQATPPPLAIDLVFDELAEAAVERLIERVLAPPAVTRTFLLAPRLAARD